MADEPILRDDFITQLRAPGIDVEVAQHRFLERLAREEDVQAVLYRFGDVDELFRDPRRTEPHGARPAMGDLSHPATDAIDDAVPIQENGDFGVARRQ